MSRCCRARARLNFPNRDPGPLPEVLRARLGDADEREEEAGPSHQRHKRRQQQRQSAPHRPPASKRTSAFHGVSFHERKGVWAAMIIAGGHLVSLGCFDEEEDAARAYDQAALYLHGR